MMRYITSLLLACLMYGSVLSQEMQEGIPLRIGLFTPYATQGGLQIGTCINLHSWKARNGKEKKFAKNFFVQPQVAFFSRADNHVSLLLAPEVGMLRLNERNRFYTAVGLGLGYLNRFQIVSMPINLGTGEVNGRGRERTGYFLPTLKAELGQIATQKPGWFANISLGRNISSAKENSAFFAVEVGISIFLFQ